MYRQIVTPKNTHLLLQIPKEFVGQELEVIAFPLLKEEKIQGKKAVKKKTAKEIDDFYNNIRIDMSNFKFDRDKANER